MQFTTKKILIGKFFLPSSRREIFLLTYIFYVTGVANDARFSFHFHIHTFVIVQGSCRCQNWKMLKIDLKGYFYVVA